MIHIAILVGPIDMAAKRRPRSREKPLRSDPKPVLPTPERFQHDIIERAQSSKGARTDDEPPLIVRTQNVLDTYLVTGRITQEQHDAGMRLYRDWRASGCEPRIVGGYAVRFGSSSNMTPEQSDARLRLNRAFDAVGPVAHGILVHVCLCNIAASQWARDRGHVERAGIVVLKEALIALWCHYESTARRRRKNADSRP